MAGNGFRSSPPGWGFFAEGWNEFWLGNNDERREITRKISMEKEQKEAAEKLRKEYFSQLGGHFK